jgi:hypothetical protein
VAVLVAVATSATEARVIVARAPASLLVRVFIASSAVVGRGGGVRGQGREIRFFHREAQMFQTPPATSTINVRELRDLIAVLREVDHDS